MAENKEDEKEEKEEEKTEDKSGDGAEGTTENTETPVKKKFSLKNLTKKQKIMALGALILIFVLIGAGVFFMKKSGHGDASPGSGSEEVANAQSGEGAAAVAENAQPPEVFFDLDDFLVNLSTTARTPSFLKLKVSLQLASDQDKKGVEEKIPFIRDNFQVYLRELTSDDLRGSAGIYRLREELLLRINKIVSPIVVNDILFKEILVQ